jgi:hypothetical protein
MASARAALLLRREVYVCKPPDTCYLGHKVILHCHSCNLQVLKAIWCNMPYAPVPNSLGDQMVHLKVEVLALGSYLALAC